MTFPANAMEGKKHVETKKLGKKILQMMNAKNICYEKGIDVSYIKNKVRYGGFNYVDVYGEITIKNNMIPVVVECGIIPSQLRIRELEKFGCIVICLGYNFLNKCKEKKIYSAKKVKK